jgi:glycosyltransferase involved in cell wall biosynthesis
MQLSVVIPTLNKVDLLRKTLAALEGQLSDPGQTWEVVVVNDGSSDGTAAFLATCAAAGRLPLQVISPERNVGRARARNLGAHAASGRFLLFLDDDIVAPPGLLAAHLALLQAEPRCGTIGYAVTDPALVDSPHFHYLDTRGTARLAAGPAPARFFVTQNAAVPRSAFLDVGGFDEDFSSYGFEDMELAFRLEEQAGLRFRVLTGPVPLHVHHHSSAEYFAKKIECGRRSLPHLARLHPGRLAEMRLQYVVDIPGGPAPAPAARLIRWFAGTGAGQRLPQWLKSWPVGRGHSPRWAGLYFRLMNLAVLCAFCQGVADGDRQLRQ